MIRIRMMYVYLLSVGMACTCVNYAMDDTQLKKIWQQTMPYYVHTIPYDCTVIAKQYARTMFDKNKEKYKNMAPLERTMRANLYTIYDAQNVILIAIRDYTRDYSKRPDGKLNPDQCIECTVRFGAPLSCEHVFDSRAGDAWERIEDMMKNHLEDHLKSLEKEKQ